MDNEKPVETVAPLRGAALRAHALGDRAAKWRHEIVIWEGQQYLVREPSVVAQKRIMSHMPEQKLKADQVDTDKIEDVVADLEVSISLGVTIDMKVERLIQCTHDLAGQRLFGEEDRAAIEKWPADDGLLNAVSAAVERLTAKAEAQGKGSGRTGNGQPSSASPAS